MHDVAMVIETDVPCRLDRLPWTRLHTLVVVALGITWVLDGLEVTIAGSIAAALGALGAVVLLQPGLLPPDWGWRAAFGIGAVLGLGILLLRRWLPESPRWLMLHSRLDECETVIGEVERRVCAAAGIAQLGPVSGRLRLVARSATTMERVVTTLLREYRQRTVLGLVLMASQAFFYNAI